MNEHRRNIVMRALDFNRKKCLNNGPGHRAFFKKANRLVSKQRRKVDAREIKDGIDKGSDVECEATAIQILRETPARDFARQVRA